MLDQLGRDHQAILGALSVQGLVTSQELQAATGKSQPTVSRLLADLSGHVVAFGRGRSTRYGLPKSIRGRPSRQPVRWIDEAGGSRTLGHLTLLAGDIVHLDLASTGSTTRGQLPWMLTPLQAQGFLGRVLARRLEGAGLGANPETWAIDSILFAALQLHDAPGAIVLGDSGDASSATASLHTLPAGPSARAKALDAFAQDVASTLPAGSSAGGEQPKFLAIIDNGNHVLVKFTPPRGTPFGERWHDLLHAEALAAEVLAEHGVDVARGTVVETAARTYLLSERFDRVGARGRRHVVSVGAAHAAFVADGYHTWAATCDALARQKRLPAYQADQALALQQFGRLIGNSDMHSGNLGLRVTLDDLIDGRFTLAPVYDMLPMRWRPDPAKGSAHDYWPFAPDAVSASGPARGPAHAYWLHLARHPKVSPALRELAGTMGGRLA